MLLSNSKLHIASELGFTLIELMVVIVIISTLVAMAATSYQSELKKAQLTKIYKELNDFRLPYQILLNEGAGVTGFSPSGLNMPAKTKYCQFTVSAPIAGSTTTNAIICTIQSLPYLQEQSLSLDRAADGSWQCRASSGIPTAYLPKECQ